MIIDTRFITKRWWLIGIAAVVLAVFAVSYLRPGKVFVDEVAEPVAVSVGVASRTCRSGWTNTSARDEHTQVLSCERDGWLVVLTPEGEFERALRLDTDGAEWITDPEEVPGWLR